MKITPHFNYAISTGNHRPGQTHANEQQRQKQLQEEPPFETTTSTTDLVYSQTTQRIRQTIHALPLQEQNLSHQGAKARDIYLGVEDTNDAELMPRINVTV